jgi:hypothetical protein
MAPSLSGQIVFATLGSSPFRKTRNAIAVQEIMAESRIEFSSRAIPRLQRQTAGLTSFFVSFLIISPAAGGVKDRAKISPILHASTAINTLPPLVCGRSAAKTIGSRSAQAADYAACIGREGRFSLEM